MGVGGAPPASGPLLLGLASLGGEVEAGPPVACPTGALRPPLCGGRAQVWLPASAPAPTPAASKTGAALDIAALVPAAMIRCGADMLPMADAHRESTESDASAS